MDDYSAMRIHLQLYLVIASILHSVVKADEEPVNCTSEKGEERSIFLWSIESKTGFKNYLFGTIHVPFTEVWQHVSERVKEALRESNTIVFELDLHNPSTVQTLMQCKNMENGGDVSDYLPSHLYFRLRQYMRKYRQRLTAWSSHAGITKQEAKKRARHIYNSIAGGWEHRRPVWLLFLLYHLSEKFVLREHIPMLDLYLAQYAVENSKKLLSIETPIEQCNPLSSIQREEVIFAINYTLSYLEFEQEQLLAAEGASRRSEGLAQLIHHYNCGSLQASIFNVDTKRLNELGFSLSPELDDKAQQINRQLREDIIVRRNVRMADRIAAMLNSKQGHNQYFFALGAGHFLGNNSLLELLNGHGFMTRPVSEADHISFRQSRRMHTFNELWVRESPQGDHRLDVSVSVVEVPSSQQRASPSITLLLSLMPVYLTAIRHLR